MTKLWYLEIREQFCWVTEYQFHLTSVDVASLEFTVFKRINKQIHNFSTVFFNFNIIHNILKSHQDHFRRLQIIVSDIFQNRVITLRKFSHLIFQTKFNVVMIQMNVRRLKGKFNAFSYFNYWLFLLWQNYVFYFELAETDQVQVNLYDFSYLVIG